MKRPFVYISIPIILGIVFYYFINISLSLILSLILVTILLGFISYWKNTSYGLGLLFLFFLLGIFLSYSRYNSSVLLKHRGESLQLEGVVEDIDYPGDNKARALVRVKSIKGRHIHKEASEKIRLTLIGNKEIGLYDTISFNAKITEPRANTNPNLYNYRLNLLSNGVFTTATIRDRDLVEIKKGNLGSLARLRIGSIGKIQEVFDRYLSEKNSSLMKSIALGDSSYLEEEEVDVFRELGIAHVIAVSGLHIGLISAVIIWTLSFMGINRRISVIIALTTIWIYGFIIGMPASVLRANITFSLLFLSQILAKPYDSINALFFALVVLLLINPFWCFNLGFQLSFITSFFIIYLTPRLKSATLSAQIGILPILAYYFNSLSLIALVANIVLVPLFTFALVLSLFLLIFSYISTNISSSIGLLVDAILNIESLMARILYSFPILSLRVASPSIYEIIGYYILILLSLNGHVLRKLHLSLVKILVFYLVFVIAFNLLYMALDTSLALEFIDVGQGDSILLRTKEGAYLIDTGGNALGDYDVGSNILYPYLVKEGIFSLRGVFISHFHDDHAKSLPYLMEKMDIGRIYIGYRGKGNELYDSIIAKAYERQVPVYLLERGDHISLGKDTDIFVLGPSEDLLKTTNEDNDLSLCLLLRHFDKEVLFTGDIEGRGEGNIVESLKRGVDFLKVPHHGSSTSSSEDLLKQAGPKAAFISVGRNNVYGHPHEEVLARYRALGIDTYRTDEAGLISLLLDKDYYHIDTFIKDKGSIHTILESYSVFIFIGIIYFFIQYLMVQYFLSAAKELERIEL